MDMLIANIMQNYAKNEELAWEGGGRNWGVGVLYNDFYYIVTI